MINVSQIYWVQNISYWFSSWRSFSLFSSFSILFWILIWIRFFLFNFYEFWDSLWLFFVHLSFCSLFFSWDDYLLFSIFIYFLGLFHIISCNFSKFATQLILFTNNLHSVYVTYSKKPPCASHGHSTSFVTKRPFIGSKLGASNRSPYFHLCVIILGNFPLG